MTIKHRFGFVGCGKIASKHSLIINNLEGASLEAFCDLDLEKAKTLSEEFGSKSFSTVEEMMDTSNPDTLVVLTPSGFHAENIKDLIKYKKNIIVEKPLALKISDLREISQLVKENDISLSVVKQNRFNKPIVFLKKLVIEGQLGKLFLGTIRVRWSRTQDYYDESTWRGTWKHDGGVITNQASHHIDMLQWFMGDVESVFARSNKFGSTLEAEDTAIVSIKFKNGALGQIEASTAIRPNDIEGSLSLFGSKGSVEVGGFSMNKLNFCNLDESISDDFSDLRFDNPMNDRLYSHREFYKDFLERISHGAVPSIGVDEGTKSMVIIHAIYKSIEEAREVYLSENSLQSKLGE